jgi:tetratricopeptide (TPR) repeat protein
VLLLHLLADKREQNTGSATANSLVQDSVLSVAEFARVYHTGLQHAARRDTSLLPLLNTLRQLPANEPFAEQLTFLRGLTQLRDGQPVLGFEQLETLATGENAGYYEQLLGLYLFERGLYPSAVARLATAQQAGNVEAALPRAYALSLSGSPDSARLSAHRAVAIPTTAAAARRLLKALPSAAPNSASVYRPFAKQYKQAAAQTEPDKAEEQYRRLLLQDPFDEAGVLQAADFLVAQGKNLAAYENLRRALLYNPESVMLLERYSLAAADAGLPDYASFSIKKLSTLLSSVEFNTFKSQFDKRRAAHRAAAAPWD